MKSSAAANSTSSRHDSGDWTRSKRLNFNLWNPRPKISRFSGGLSEQSWNPWSKDWISMFSIFFNLLTLDSKIAPKDLLGILEFWTLDSRDWNSIFSIFFNLPDRFTYFNNLIWKSQSEPHQHWLIHSLCEVGHDALQRAQLEEVVYPGPLIFFQRHIDEKRPKFKDKFYNPGLPVFSKYVLYWLCLELN